MCRTMSNMNKIAVVGFGNILMRDDGAGICVIRRLLDLPPQENVYIFDGGVASFEILDNLRSYAHIIMVDALAGGGSPGDIYRLEPETIVQDSASYSLSLHDGTLLHALQLARCAGPMPPVTIYGIEPENISFGLAITSQVLAAVDRLTGIIYEELTAGRMLFPRGDEEHF